ncbi:rhamnogalacturonan acetylesterase [Jeotgalibacillus sp. S-D1]|uniref:rhamnogalacturonan acetylesterase n=1 Tax=Jeotgalibacillus sp. S-D1 TaxID=2552189 RepID=UPI00105A58CF|nr:rhamnogalacturonan acetylesterase [Jeotgalibacillus sp. S-D1]TDL34264.1 rhamnogalacturonan acetylesterase [Jeotgalibacillus sp. S-D1]
MTATVFLAGDSTMADYHSDFAPQAGWGMMLQPLLPPDIRVVNAAMNGRSSKSFIDEGRLSHIKDELSQGDYLLIQFGHNDQKIDPDRHTDPFTSYKENLSHYIEAATDKKSTPILLSPVARRNFDQKGQLLSTHGDYPKAMKEAAEELSVPFIDLTMLSANLLQTLGEEKSKDLFMWLPPHQHSNYPEGVQDNTHFNEKGAAAIANLVVQELSTLFTF